MTARAAVTITFWQNGLLYGAWATRIPALRDRLDLSDGQVGLALACIAVGSIIGMPLAGRAAARWGSRPATRLVHRLHGADVGDHAGRTVARGCCACCARRWARRTVRSTS